MLYFSHAGQQEGIWKLKNTQTTWQNLNKSWQVPSLPPYPMPIPSSRVKSCGRPWCLKILSTQDSPWFFHKFSRIIKPLTNPFPTFPTFPHMRRPARSPWKQPCAHSAPTSPKPWGPSWPSWRWCEQKTIAEVWRFGGFLKSWYPQIIQSSWYIHAFWIRNHPLVPHLWKPPLDSELAHLIVE